MGLDDVKQPINEQFSESPEKNFSTEHEELRSSGDEILRTKLLPVKFPMSRRIKDDIDKLSQVFNDLNKNDADPQQVKAVGLAASQIGLTTNAFIVMLDKPVLMINPKIIGHSKSQKTKWEMCLSIPAVMVRVPRWKEISVQFQDENGIEHVMNVKSSKWARRIQHETDHTLGILISDYITKNNPPVFTDRIGEA